MKRALIPLLFFIGLSVALAISLTKDPRRLEDTLIDHPFPAFSLSSLDEPDAVLTEQTVQGHISVVNVFGSWCVTCNVEHPILMEVSRDENIRLIGLNWRDDREEAKTWLAKRGNPYDLIIFDPDSELAIPLGVSGAPETFVTDKNGRIRYKHSGAISFEDWDNIFQPLFKTLEAE